MGSKKIVLPRCTLCNKKVDCFGNKFHTPESTLQYKAPKDEYRLYKGNKFTNWDEVKTQVMVSRMLNVPMRVITNVPVPAEILELMRYSSSNILQVEYSVLTDNHWVGNFLYNAFNLNKLYTIVHYISESSLFKLEDIIELTNQYSGICRQFNIQVTGMEDTDSRLILLESYMEMNKIAYCICKGN